MITTPEKWDGITRSWATREYVRQVNLVIIDEIHLLGVDRGAVLEAIITRLKLLTRRSCVRESPARLLGLSTALANAGDVAEWLGIRDHVCVGRFVLKCNLFRKAFSTSGHLFDQFQLMSTSKDSLDNITARGWL
ncbi:hypothetical protein ANCDUO_21677 [Ancylostoma duodenale]|uniref:Helicase ATP-binding domain-containing protein n=1 Tax=Ancylostoma duodenale TaxID=51022 RepID=A0A0C2FTM9_9BILA|nr:hypothetical protein ANCDUO_21677 [Ancylostoma duodenale]